MVRQWSSSSYPAAVKEKREQQRQDRLLMEEAEKQKTVSIQNKSRGEGAQKRLARWSTDEKGIAAFLQTYTRRQTRSSKTWSLFFVHVIWNEW